MEPSASRTVDVREMLCAQALALVAQTLARLDQNAILEVITNTEDVRRDLVIWAQKQGHHLDEMGSGRVRITRRG